MGQPFPCRCCWTHGICSSAWRARRARWCPLRAWRRCAARSEKLLQERAADISLDFWRAARPAADVANNDDKLNAAKMRAVVRPLSLRIGFS